MLLPRRHQHSPKVFVGLSGGVDSAVSAALLVRAGYHVTGVFIRIQLSGYPCPAAQDRLEAMRVAAHLKIPFIEVDLSREYEQAVFEPSIEEFKKGRTPNPDTLCNEKIKFGVFFDFCRSRGAEYVATGHYAQTKDGELYMSADKNKDQTYFLWALPKEKLLHTLFPIGHLTKPEVRRLALKLGLPNAQRKDSQGLCFLGDIGLSDLLTREISPTPGDVVLEDGTVVGQHRGVELYTLGERHGFTLFATTPHTEPHYVVAKEAKTNTLVVSPHKFPTGAQRTRISLGNINRLGPSFTTTPEGEQLMARYRYRQPLIAARMLPGTEESQVELLEPHYVPVGQSLVLYQGERCLGGGVIEDATLLS